MSKKRVVVTGLGAINGVGKNVNEMWANLLAGKSGITKIPEFAEKGITSLVGGKVLDFDVTQFDTELNPKDARRMARFTQFAYVAGLEAVKDSGLDILAEAEQVGCWIGSGIGGLEVLEEQAKILNDRGARKSSPFMIPMMISDMGAGQLAIRIGAKGPNACTTSACASGTHSIGDAFRKVQNGEAIAMVAGGAEACITPLGYAGFCAARALSTAYNETPEKASRPFEKNRDGFVMGEGAGIVVLEEMEHAKARGAKIYCELVGYGASGDAYHITAPAPEGEGGARAIQMCLKDANLKPEEVQYVNAHGTSTDANDKNESAAIKNVFGAWAKNGLWVSSTKGAMGHLLGAAGGVEFVVICKAIETGQVPPTINYDVPDPECDLDYVPNTARKGNITAAISNSFGFGGHNAILAVKKFQ
jgi:3-oxoacyl-[acyl-carrier-protein] synthase II